MSGFDPLAIRVFASSVAMIAEEMGAVLTRGSLSPNIRERRDASCARVPSSAPRKDFPGRSALERTNPSSTSRARNAG